MRRVRAAWAWPVAIFVGFTAAALIFFPGGPGFPSGDPPPAPAALLGPVEHVNTRSWRTIARNPGAHAEERIVLWGQVTRVSTTPDGLSVRANVDAARHTPQGGRVNYPTPAILHGDRWTLRNLAQGNIFRAEVTVDGAATGEPAVPAVTVTDLKITDRSAR